MSNLRFIIYLVVASSCWGGSFYAIHHAIEGLSVTFAVFLRIVVAVLTIGIVLFFQKDLKFSFNHIFYKTLLIGALGMTVPWMLLFWAEQFVQPALAAVITSSVPVLVLFMNVILHPKQKRTSAQWIGVAFGFLGILVIFYPEIDFQNITNSTLGLFAIAAMALSYALNVMGTRSMGHYYKEELNLFYQSLGGLVSITPLILLNSETLILPAFNWTHFGAVFYLGAMSSTLALFLMFRIIKEKGTIEGAAITFFVPVVAIILDAVMLNQWIGLWQAMGTGLILMGLFFVNFKDRLQARLSQGTRQKHSHS